MHVCELTDIIGIEAEDYALEEYRFAYYCNGENEEPYVSYPNMSPEDLPITLRLSDGSAITETPLELYSHFNNPSTDSLFHYNTSKPDGKWQLGETIEATISLDIPIGSEEDEAFNELRCTCNITVVPSTVESVEIAPVELWELVDGMPCADENDQPCVDYMSRLERQMCFTVRYKDGSVRTGLHWDELDFALSNLPSIVFPWGECGTYTGSLLAAGIECPYTVTVKENEVTALHANDQALRLSDCTHWAFRSDSSGELTVQKILNDLSDLLQFTVDLRDGTSFTGTAREISEKTGHWVGWIIDGEDGSDMTAPAPGTYHVVTFLGNLHFYGDSFDLTFYDGAFMDVPADAYYAAPVDWAVEQGVTRHRRDPLQSEEELHPRRVGDLPVARGRQAGADEHRKPVHGRQDDGLVLQAGPVGRREGHYDGHRHKYLLAQERMHPRRGGDLPLARRRQAGADDNRESIHGRRGQLLLQGGFVGCGERHHDGYLQNDLCTQKSMYARRGRDLPVPRPGISLRFCL